MVQRKRGVGVAGCALLVSLLGWTATGWAQANQGEPQVPPLPPPEAPELIRQWNEVRARVASQETAYKAGTAPVAPANRAYLRFKLDQAQLWLFYHDQQMLLDSATAIRYVRMIVAQVELTARVKGDATREISKTLAPQVEERAYFAADGSAQPYWVYLPANYTPTKQYPLVLMLHGYDPALTKVYPWLLSDEQWGEATRRGIIFVTTYGRRNSDFVNVGEDDTYAVRREVERLYTVDKQRVGLLGISMGGTGALVEAMHRPGAWTNVAALSARSDLYLWAGLKREDVPSWKRPLYDADNPRTLVSNLVGTPLVVAHGELDLVVPVSYARTFAQDLLGAGVAFRYQEVPAGPHTIFADPTVLNGVFDWLKTMKPRTDPRRVQFTTASLAYNQAYWAALEGFDDYEQPATLDVELRPGNALIAKASNVRQFSLTPPATLFDKDKPLTLSVNGGAALTFAPGAAINWSSEAAPAGGAEIPAPATLPAAAAQAAPQEAAKAQNATPLAVTPPVQPALGAAPAPNKDTAFPGVKSPTRCGPIKECYRAPFLLVYGTDDRDKANTLAFAQEWDAFVDGVPPIKADKDVTEADKQNFNLVLFGTRATNDVLRSVAAQMPVELLTPHSVRIGTQTHTVAETELTDELGVQFCYPSPWSASKMLVVQSGLYWGAALPTNHKYDLLPEFIVYNGEADPSDMTNRALYAGWFDHKWQLPAKANTQLPVPVKPPAPLPPPLFPVPAQ